ncbi:MAG: c-type cytochrome [Bacteroidia bacterium]|nr:c-type cytochrome [Bacteroidia bacterium]
MKTPKYTISLLTVFMAFIIFSALGQEKWHWPEKATNLKVLPKNTTGEELHAKMHEFTKSLGVKCMYCHEGKEGASFTEVNFASDAKPEKVTARKMMKMTDAINRKFMDKMGEHGFDHITCVTCHRGSPHPMTSIDSLVVK